MWTVAVEHGVGTQLPIPNKGPLSAHSIHPLDDIPFCNVAANHFNRHEDEAEDTCSHQLALDLQGRQV